MEGYNQNFKVRGNAYVAVCDLLRGGVDIPKFIQDCVFDPADNIQRVNVRIDILELGVDIPQKDKEVVSNTSMETGWNIGICNPYVHQFLWKQITSCSYK